MKKLVSSVLGFSILTFSPLFAQTVAHFSFSTPAPIVVAGTRLKAGDYKVDVEGSEATFKIDGKTFKVPAALHPEPTVFKATSIEATEGNVRAIHVGGTVITVTFGSQTATGGN